MLGNNKNYYEIVLPVYIEADDVEDANAKLNSIMNREIKSGIIVSRNNCHIELADKDILIKSLFEAIRNKDDE